MRANWIWKGQRREHEYKLLHRNQQRFVNYDADLLTIIQHESKFWTEPIQVIFRPFPANFQQVNFQQKNVANN